MLNIMLKIELCSKRLFAVVFVSFWLISVTNATLIIPPANMNEMIEQSETIVYGQVIGHKDKYGSINSFRISESFKGDLSIGQLIDLKEYGNRTDAEITMINGDVDFKIGSNYLLFLFQDGSGFYKARLLSLSVYEEILFDGQVQFAHQESILDMCYLTDINESLLDSYRATDFKQVLRSDQSFNIKGFPYWNINHKGQSIGSSKKSTCPRPSHCVTLIGNESQLNSNCTLGANPSPAKHPSSTFVVKVASSASSDPSQSNASSLLVNAVAEINNMSGLNVSMASPMTQTCATTNCNKVSEVVDTDCNPNGLNEIWVFFDDPCDEVADLVNCGGLLGLGGTFAKTPCHTDACGDMWLTAFSPYFVMNNGAGCLNNYNYTALIIHEMIHSFNVSHIAGSCTAIMNAGLCGANNPNAPNYGITQLDRDCIEWMYNQCPVNENFTGVTYPNNYTDPEFAQNQITATNILVENGADILYDAGSIIELNPSFEVELGAVFHALIGGCMP